MNIAVLNKFVQYFSQHWVCMEQNVSKSLPQKTIKMQTILVIKLFKHNSKGQRQ